MSFTDRAALHAAIANWLDRDDLTALIPDFVELCEARMRRSEATRSLTRTTLTLDTSPVSLPSDFKAAYSLYYDGSSSAYGPIKLLPPEAVAEHKALFGLTGIPEVAAVLYDSLELILGPVPGGSYEAVLIYDQGMDSSYVLTHFPDLYLYGSLAEASPYLRDDGRVPLWEQRFQMGLEELRRYNERAMWHGNTLAVRLRRALGE